MGLSQGSASTRDAGATRSSGVRQDGGLNSTSSSGSSSTGSFANSTGGSTGGTGATSSSSSGGGGCGQAPCDAGTICDEATQGCRLPVYGEDCDPTVGCGSQPPGMICAEASGSSKQTCLVPCASTTDSSTCPYGMSCGDPSSPGYCSPAASATCTLWTPCMLGAGVTGLCVPLGQGASCLATGTLPPYAACNPQTSNNDSPVLCASGICLSAAGIPQTLGAAPAQSGGYCVPPCGGQGSAAAGAPTCASDQHCFETPGDPYGLCLPGSPCSLGGSKSCQFGWWCLPDSFAAETGGCIDSQADAGATGAACEQPVAFTVANPCVAGDVCLASPDGAAACAEVCLLSGADETAACGTCTAVADGGAVGLCE